MALSYTLHSIYHGDYVEMAKQNIQNAKKNRMKNTAIFLKRKKRRKNSQKKTIFKLNRNVFYEATIRTITVIVAAVTNSLNFHDSPATYFEHILNYN